MWVAPQWNAAKRFVDVFDVTPIRVAIGPCWYGYRLCREVHPVDNITNARPRSDLHQTSLDGVIRRNLGVFPKLAIVTFTSFIATLILYDVFVRHSNVMRFLFGMRPLRAVKEAK